MKKYIIALLTLIFLAALIFGFFMLGEIVFKSSDTIAGKFISSIGLSFVLMGLEWGNKPTEYGRKNDLIVLGFLSVIVVITTIILNIFCAKFNTLRLILVCISTPVLGFGAYWIFTFYENWNRKRLANK